MVLLCSTYAQHKTEPNKLMNHNTHTRRIWFIEKQLTEMLKKAYEKSKIVCCVTRENRLQIKNDNENKSFHFSQSIEWWCTVYKLA